ncbi:Amino acid transporter [Bacillus pseudomycoides DSM 12442]|nr:Amino acid transporter [Bacillus pseudomycoides DSM 12442]
MVHDPISIAITKPPRYVPLFCSPIFVSISQFGVVNSATIARMTRMPTIPITSVYTAMSLRREASFTPKMLRTACSSKVASTIYKRVFPPIFQPNTSAMSGARPKSTAGMTMTKKQNPSQPENHPNP